MLYISFLTRLFCNSIKGYPHTYSMLFLVYSVSKPPYGVRTCNAVDQFCQDYENETLALYAYLLYIPVVNIVYSRFTLNTSIAVTNNKLQFRLISTEKKKLMWNNFVYLATRICYSSLRYFQLIIVCVHYYRFTSQTWQLFSILSWKNTQ